VAGGSVANRLWLTLRWSIPMPAILQPVARFGQKALGGLGVLVLHGRRSPDLMVDRSKGFLQGLQGRCAIVMTHSLEVRPRADL
jgi:hypothetical protein